MIKRYLPMAKSASEGLWRYLRQGDARTLRHRLDLLRQLVGDPVRQARVIGALARRDLGPILLHQPFLPIKYLKQNYLAHDLTVDERSRLIVDHYALLLDRVGARARLLPRRPIPIWLHRGESCDHRIDLSFSQEVHYEGELTLCYRLDGAPVYWLGFSFVRGESLGFGVGEAALVSRVQMWADYQTVQRTARDCGGNFPTFSLFAAVEGLAQALRFEGIIGVNAANQASVESGAYCNQTAYDALFAAMGAHPVGDAFGGALPHPDYYWLPLSQPERPLSESSSAHRRRARRRRAFRAAVREDCCARLRRLLGLKAGAALPLELPAEAAPIWADRLAS
jgi:uncharacterized protein VirK/YbjX